MRACAGLITAAGQRQFRLKSSARLWETSAHRLVPPHVLSTARTQGYCSGGTLETRTDGKAGTMQATAAQQSGDTASQQFDASSSGQQQSESYAGVPKLIVFGGNGFVGSRVAQEGLNTGLSVVSINRSGPPRAGQGGGGWVSSVEWVRADVFNVASWRDHLQGAVGVVSTLGGFGSNEFMRRICGEANQLVMAEAATAGVTRFAFISVHDYGLPGMVLPGYFQGKKNAEATLMEKFPAGGVALRPGFIHGTRQVGPVGVPLGLVGAPLEKVLGFLPTRSLAGLPLAGAAFVPPVSAEAVGRAAVAAATDPAVPAGIMDVWQIAKFGGS